MSAYPESNSEGANPSVLSAERPAAKTTSAERPAAETTSAERPAAKTTSAGRPAAEATSAERPAAETTSAERPAAETTSAERPAAETTSAERPAAETTSAERPAAKTTSAGRPAAEATSAERPAAETTSAERPAAETTSAERPAAETTSAERPAAETTSAERPAAETSAPPQQSRLHMLSWNINSKNRNEWDYAALDKKLELMEAHSGTLPDVILLQEPLAKGLDKKVRHFRSGPPPFVPDVNREPKQAIFYASQRYQRTWFNHKGRMGEAAYANEWDSTTCVEVFAHNGSGKKTAVISYHPSLKEDDMETYLPVFFRTIEKISSDGMDAYICICTNFVIEQRMYKNYNISLISDAHGNNGRPYVFYYGAINNEVQKKAFGICLRENKGEIDYKQCGDDLKKLCVNSPNCIDFLFVHGGPFAPKDLLVRVPLLGAFQRNYNGFVRGNPKPKAQKSAAQNNEAQNSAAQNNAAQNNAAQNNAAQNNEAQNSEAQNNEAQNNEAQNNAAQNNEAQNSEAQNNAAQNNEAQNSAAQNNEAQNNEAQNNAAQNNAAQNNEAQNNEAQNNAAQNNAAQNNEAQNNEAQNNAAQNNAAQKCSAVECEVAIFYDNFKYEGEEVPHRNPRNSPYEGSDIDYWNDRVLIVKLTPRDEKSRPFIVISYHGPHVGLTKERKVQLAELFFTQIQNLQDLDVAEKHSLNGMDVFIGGDFNCTLSDKLYGEFTLLKMSGVDSPIDYILYKPAQSSSITAEAVHGEPNENTALYRDGGSHLPLTATFTR